MGESLPSGPAETTPTDPSEDTINRMELIESLEGRNPDRLQVVYKNKISLHSQDPAASREGDKVLEQLTPYTWLKVLYKKPDGKWYKVETTEGTKGWISAYALDYKTPLVDEIYEVKNSNTVKQVRIELESPR